MKIRRPVVCDQIRLSARQVTDAIKANAQVQIALHSSARRWTP